MTRIKPLIQNYDHYSEEDFAVWKLLFKRQMALLQQHATHYYLEALEQIGFNAETIPDFQKTNKHLEAYTGWRLVVAPELVPHETFFALLAQRLFPATCWLRTMEELDYLEEPDMFHDVFGHVPLLANQAYADFMEAFGKLAIQWRHDPVVLKMLSGIYWFTIEFGLIAEKGATRLLGAGILSSTGETKHALSAGPQKMEFDLASVVATPYRTDTLQDKFYVLNAFEQLPEILPELQKHIETYAGSSFERVG